MKKDLTDGITPPSAAKDPKAPVDKNETSDLFSKCQPSKFHEDKRNAVRQEHTNHFTNRAPGAKE